MAEPKMAEYVTGGKAANLPSVYQSHPHRTNTPHTQLGLAEGLAPFTF